jgi:hypothetical protein
LSEAVFWTHSLEAVSVSEAADIGETGPGLILRDCKIRYQLSSSLSTPRQHRLPENQINATFRPGIMIGPHGGIGQKPGYLSSLHARNCIMIEPYPTRSLHDIRPLDPAKFFR